MNQHFTQVKMGNLPNLFLAGMIFLFCCSIGSAQIIYSNNFALGGATNIWGSAPTVANNYAGGTSSATWNDALGTNDTGALLANGTNNTTSPDSWLLPFYPQSGYVYTLTASITFSGNPGNWIGLGFAQNDSVNVPLGYGRFADNGNNGPTGYDWMILTESSGGVAFYTGPVANNPSVYSGAGFTSGPQTVTAQVILNTSGNQWTITAYVNGIQMGSTVAYANYVPISAVGITQSTLTTSSAVRWNYLTLAATGTSSTTNAQIIYTNSFALGEATNIWGSAPTAANTYAGGTSSATWNDVLGTNDTGDLLANGADNSKLGDSWLLPFYPQPGHVYTLTASLTFTGNPGNWLGLGFAQNDVNVPAGYGRFTDSGNGGPTGYDWMIMTESSGSVAYFTGPGANSPSIYSGTGFTAGPQTLTAQVVLNTSGSQWVIAAYVNGTQLGNTYAYSNYPPISAVGITQSTVTTPSAVQWNSLTLTAIGAGPETNTVNATVSFSPANTGLPLNPSFNGLSYEKAELSRSLFTSTNTALIKLFSLIGPAVLRIGGGSVDQMGWNGISNLTAITSLEVDQFAGFVNALPTNWKVIYGINFSSNTPATCAAEAAYAAKDLGSHLLGFEIGNEPDEYPYDGIRSSSYTVSQCMSQWQPLAAAITNAVPGWAITNGGNGWTLTGPATADHSAWTETFAQDEPGIASLATQHYYRGNAQIYSAGSPAAMQLLMTPDANLPGTIATLVSAINAANFPLGLRMDESGSMVNGGLANISNAFGAALWTLDYMFTVALNGGQGINFHGGGLSPYSPLIDNGTNVFTVGPEFYALKMLSLVPPGNVIPATVTSADTNLTAYGVWQTNGAISVLLNNKDTIDTAMVSINLGPTVGSAQVTELTGPSLYSTSGFTLGGAPISTSGSWAGGVQGVLSAANGLLTVSVPPITAILLNPVVAPPGIASSVKGNQLTLSWPTNYTGWLLESNSIGVASMNWFPVPGSGSITRMQIMIQPGQSNVFYRLSAP